MADNLKKTGERQVGTELDDIRNDHKNRYLWVQDKLNSNEVIIDAGCGIGYGSRILSKKCASVTSFDISNAAIDYANKYWKQSNIQFIQADLHLLELEPKSIDKIVAFEVIEHLAFPEVFIEKAYLGLKVGGSLYISVPNEDKIAHSIELNPFHFKHYRLDEITNLCKEGGFEIKEQVYQDYDELFSDRPGNFILLELRKVSDRADKSTKISFSKTLGLLLNYIQDRSESISALKKELEAKTKLSEKRAALLRELRHTLDKQRKETLRENENINIPESIKLMFESLEDRLNSSFFDLLDLKDKKIEELRCAIQEQKVDFENSLKLTQSKYEAKISYLQKEFDNKAAKREEEIDTKNRLLKESQEDISNQLNKIRQLEKKLEDLTFVNNYWRNEVENSAQLIIEKNTRISKAENKVESQVKNYVSLQSSFDKLKNEMAQVSRQYSVALTEIKDLKTETECAKKLAVEKTNSISSLLQREEEKVTSTVVQILNGASLVNSDKGIASTLKAYYKEVKLKRIVKASPLFDASWYVKKYSDVASSGLTAELHYLRIGAVLGRYPSANFDVKRYFHENKDLDKAAVNPVIHFESHGKREGRKVHPIT